MNAFKNFRDVNVLMTISLLGFIYSYIEKEHSAAFNIYTAVCQVLVSISSDLSKQLIYKRKKKNKSSGDIIMPIYISTGELHNQITNNLTQNQSPHRCPAKFGDVLLYSPFLFGMKLFSKQD